MESDKLSISVYKVSFGNINFINKLNAVYPMVSLKKETNSTGFKNQQMARQQVPDIYWNRGYWSNAPRARK